MSKNVRVNNVNYTGISQVKLNTVDGDTALFKDADEITEPSGDLEVTENGTYNVSRYKNVIINVPMEDNSVIINTDQSATITLENNTEYRRGEIANLTISLPTDIPEVFETIVCFSSGETATVVTLPSNVALQGASVNNGNFIPDTNCRYNLIFWNDGEKIWCIICCDKIVSSSGGESGGNAGDTTQDGTETHPYLIATAADLKQLADEVDGGENKSNVHYALSADIDLSTYASWDPIGAKDKSSSDASAGFAGVLDGRGHVIKNLNVSGVQYAGLFGTNFTGTVMNLGIVSGAINTSVASSTCGAICRKTTNSSAKIVNCYSRVPCTAVARSSGLIDEIAAGMLVGCYQAAEVDGGSGYAIKGSTTATGDIHYCLWDKTLTTNGYTTTTNSSNNTGLTTSEFATAATTLNANLSAVATKAGIDVSKLCTWEDGSDGYPRLVVSA